MKLNFTQVAFILIASNLTDSSAECGPDSDGKFVVPGLFNPNRKVDCAEAKKYPTHRCEHPTFQEECPSTCCDHIKEACEDKKTRVFIAESHFPDKKRGCQWVGRKDKSRRCSYPVIKVLCPFTCGLCPPFQPFSSKKELKKAVNVYCANKADWVSHLDYAKYGPIKYWNVSQVTNMAYLFYKKSTCNPDISNWDVGNVTTFAAMFYKVTSFNKDLSSWDVSSATNISAMFMHASSFNQDISGWETSSGEYFGNMFNRATSFNQDISGWDLSSSISFNFMFYDATSFNQNLCPWETALANAQYKSNVCINTNCVWPSCGR